MPPMEKQRLSLHQVKVMIIGSTAICRNQWALRITHPDLIELPGLPPIDPGGDPGTGIFVVGEEQDYLFAALSFEINLRSHCKEPKVLRQFKKFSQRKQLKFRMEYNFCVRIRVCL